MAVTMVDIAKRSGVSIATVSKYINGGPVKKKNRENIEKAIAELGYKVNTTARALKTSRSMTVGVIMESLTNLFYSSVMSVMEDYFLENGYSSIICETKGSGEEAFRKLDLLLSKRVDGIIYFTSQCDEAFVLACARHQINLVMVDSIHGNAGGNDWCDYVFTDNVQGAFDAVQYLVECGHRDIAVITGAERHFSAAGRLRGYLDCMERNGIEVKPEYIFRDEYNIDGGYRCAARLAELEARPTAVLACNYMMTLGAMVSFHEHNLKIGEGISLVSFDEIQANKAFRPALTTVSQSLEDIGRTAAGRILMRIRQESLPSRTIKIAADLIKRDSVVIIKK